MNSSPYRCETRRLSYPALREMALELGFHSAAVTPARPVNAEAVELYSRWIAAGLHASMDYLDRYHDLRADPSLLLPGARTLIVTLTSYSHPVAATAPGARLFASYAHGTDYHIVVRDRLLALAERLKGHFDEAEFRPTVDTAPMRERYWARRAGLGFIGMNAQLTVPGQGSQFFIGTLLTSAEIEPGAPFTDQELTSAEEACRECGRCVAACPGKAIHQSNRFVDARRCLSYLTIEHRGPLPEGTALRGHIYGCDDCLKACPHNAGAPCKTEPEFELRPEIAALTKEAIAKMTPEDFSNIFRRSAVKRTKLAGLLRNINADNQ